MEINLLVGVVTMALGLFLVTSPARAAKIWGSEHLAGIAPEKRPSFLRLYRLFGVILSVGGALFALDSTGFWNYPHN
jgi:hypothetical protein